ncbi:MAG: sarcosine oxidase subunit delta [Rhodospirillales bacterium]|jgi:sarcosine oxidase subunit delta|nr:sarcosine oxidase subunit delta [Rhodospirillales bacterium]
MLLLDCPFCGVRPEIEFACGGRSHVQRPGPPEQVSDEQWSAYLFFQPNPKGLLRERWRHVVGCGLWFNVERDTVTHAVTQVYEMGAAPAETTP